MLKRDNYISFAIVVGFFVGVMFGFVKFDDPELMVLWAIISTCGVYLIVTLSASIYYIFFDTSKAQIRKKEFEESLEYYRKEFDKKEQEAQSVRNFIKSLKNTD